MSSKERLWIFANGEIADPQRLSGLIDAGDDLMAADGGARHLLRMGFAPRWVIGDLDSLSDEEIGQLTALGAKIERFPVEKDETDLELALQRGVAEGYRAISIAGALGGRLDQTLANISLLTKKEYAAMDLRLEDGLEEVCLVDGQREIIGAVGDLVSLLPWGGPAEGVKTQGLQYALRQETLYPDRSRGVSNVMLAERATVSLTRGLLICVHRRGDKYRSFI